MSPVSQFSNSMRRAGIALTLAGLAVTAAAQGPRVAEKAVLDAAGHRRLDVHVVLSGELVDAAGRPLVGARAKVDRVRFDPAAPELARTEREEVAVDGFFLFECDACLEIRVQFSRPGYHQNEISAGYGKEGETVVEARNRRVVLQEIGTLVRLERYDGILMVAEAGGEEALSLDPRAGGQTAPLELLPKSGPAGEELPLVRLVAQRAGGRLATREVAGKAAVVVAAEAPRLDFGPDGGAVLYQPQARNPHERGHEMREAPAEGYARILELDGASGETVHFYCRIGNLYGRGTAGPVAVEETSRGRRVVAPVAIFLNPDGSRNLETLE